MTNDDVTAVGCAQQHPDTRGNGQVERCDVDTAEDRFACREPSRHTWATAPALDRTASRCCCARRSIAPILRSRRSIAISTPASRTILTQRRPG